MAPDSSQQSFAQALIPYTGYYPLDATTGAFLMISTDMTYSNDGAPPLYAYKRTITLSADGKAWETLPLLGNCSLDDGHLVVQRVDGYVSADLHFNATTAGMSVAGLVHGRDVAGVSPFAPVEPTTWCGTYYRQSVAGGVYEFAAALQINADGTVLYAPDGGTLQMVPGYTYDYAMFVLILASAAAPTLPMYEMGTSKDWGRVAGDATNGSMLVSLQRQVPVPIL